MPDYATKTLREALQWRRSRTGNRTNCLFALSALHATMLDMVKRILATSLWFYGAWTAAAGAAWLLGTPHELGPIVGVAAGLIVWFDPKHVLWPRVARASTRETAANREPMGA